MMAAYHKRASHRRQQPKHLFDMIPLYIVTPTWPKSDRLRFIERLIQTLRPADPALWIVVEGTSTKDPGVDDRLRSSGLPTMYLTVESGDTILYQRKRGLELIRDENLSGVVYMADDDNLYHPELFNVLRRTKRVGILPVGCLGPSGIERPIVKAGKIVGWDADVKERTYPVNAAAIVFHTDIIHEIGDPLWPVTAPLGGENEFLTRVVRSTEDLEVLTENVLLWKSAALGDIEGLPGYSPIPSVAHLEHYEEGTALGPVQRSEACLLYSLTLVTRPRYVVELGAGEGHSARNFLQALDPWSQLTSIDCVRGRHVDELERTFTNFTFLHKPQEEVSADDFKEQIELLFIDGSHDLQKNIIFYERIKERLAATGVLVVHDTGAWVDSFIRSHQRWIGGLRCPWTNALYHRTDELRFVQWLQNTYSEWNAVHLHCNRCLRHGLTLLQRDHAFF